PNDLETPLSQAYARIIEIVRSGIMGMPFSTYAESLLRDRLIGDLRKLAENTPNVETILEYTLPAPIENEEELKGHDGHPNATASELAEHERALQRGRMEMEGKRLVWDRVKQRISDYAIMLIDEIDAVLQEWKETGPSLAPLEWNGELAILGALMKELVQK